MQKPEIASAPMSCSTWLKKDFACIPWVYIAIGIKSKTHLSNTTEPRGSVSAGSCDNILLPTLFPFIDHVFLSLFGFLRSADLYLLQA